MPIPPNDVVHWLSVQSETSAFARSLLTYAGKHGGGLTEAQLARVRRMMDRETRRFRKWTRPGRDEIVAMTRRWPPED